MYCGKRGQTNQDNAQIMFWGGGCPLAGIYFWLLVFDFLIRRYSVAEGGININERWVGMQIVTIYIANIDAVAVYWLLKIFMNFFKILPTFVNF